MANRYWVGGSGTWDDTSTSSWSATSGGAAGASAPTSADVVLFDAGSGSGVVSVAAGAAANAVTQNSSTITVQLASDLALSGGSYVFAQGILDLSSYTLTSLTFITSYSTSRSIAFGTGKIVLTGSGASVWSGGNHAGFSATGSKRVELSYSGATGTRTITNGSSGGTEATAVYFYVTAGTDTIAITNSSVIGTLDCSGFSGTLGNNVVFIYGDLLLSSGITLTAGANTYAFASTNASPREITCAGKTLDFPVTFNGVGGGWKFIDTFSVGPSRATTLINGTLDANDQAVSIGNFSLGVGTKTLTLGSNTWTVAGTLWNANTNVANLTVSPSSGVISMTSASAKAFAGGGKTWPTLNQGGAGALTIQQSNGFASITNTVRPATITLTAATTQTVSALKVSGTAGNLITLNTSTAGTQATLSDSAGTNEVSFVSIKDINATGGAAWIADLKEGNIDAGNNLGWDFSPAVRQVFRQVFSPIFRPIF